MSNPYAQRESIKRNIDALKQQLEELSEIVNEAFSDEDEDTPDKPSQNTINDVNYVDVVDKLHRYVNDAIERYELCLLVATDLRNKRKFHKKR